MNISDAAFRLETRIALPEDEVHLWRVDLATVAKGEQRWEQILSADERARAARFHFSQERQYFTATRALLRTILGGYVDSDPNGTRVPLLGKRKAILESVPIRNPDGVQRFSLGHNSAACLRARDGHSALMWNSFVRISTTQRSPADFFQSRNSASLPRSRRLSGITVSSAAGPEKKRTSRPKEQACRFLFTSLTSP